MSRIKWVNQSFADNLRAVQLIRGMSMHELAKQINVSDSSCSLYENGNMLPRYKNRMGIIKALGFDTVEQFERQKELFLANEEEYLKKYFVGPSGEVRLITSESVGPKSEGELENFGERVRVARKACGYSQRDLAKLMKVSQVAVLHWEHNASIPTLRQLLSLATLLDVPVKELAGDFLDSYKDVVPDALRLSLAKASGGRKPKALSCWEIKFLKITRGLNIAGKRKVLAYAKDLLDTGNYTTEEQEGEADDGGQDNPI